MFDTPLTHVKGGVKVIGIFDFASDQDQMCNKSKFSCRESFARRLVLRQKQTRARKWAITMLFDSGRAKEIRKPGNS